jgi:hypothetical protein
MKRVLPNLTLLLAAMVFYVPQAIAQQYCRLYFTMLNST